MNAVNMDAFDRCNELIAKAQALALCATNGGLRAMNDDDRANYMWALSDMLTEAREVLSKTLGRASP